jgi:hypothetical protein
MSRPPMDAPNAGREDPLLQRYQEANALDLARPSAALRDAVLAHAKVHAPAPEAPVKTQKHAANDAPWKLRALGSLAVVGLMGLLVMQFERSTTEEQKVALGTPAEQADTYTAAPEAKASASEAEPLGDSTAPIEAENSPAVSAIPPASPSPASPAAITQEKPSTRPAPAAQAVAPETIASTERATASAPAAIEPMAKAAPAPAMEAASDMAQADAAAPMERARSAAPVRSNEGESGVNARREIGSGHQAGAARDKTIPAMPTLHTAAAKGDLSAVQSLLAQGVPVNARDSLGRTPLMVAVLGGHQSLVVALMDAGGDADLRDNAGLSAADHAMQAGHADWLPLLQPRR